MKVGSIVECIITSSCNCEVCRKVDTPKMGSNYTIRGIVPKGSRMGFNDGTTGNYNQTCVYLEEIVNTNVEPLDHEPAFPMKWFRELLPPMEIDIEEILKEKV